MQRLELGNLQIAKNKVSYLELYCTENAKKVLEGNEDLVKNLNLFDEITTIKIKTQSEIEMNPPSYDTLIERTEFYGIKRELFTSVEENFFPPKVIANALIYIVGLEMPASKLKWAWYPELKGIEYNLEVEPKKALELTQKVRDFLPEKIVKQVSSYLKIPA